MQKFADFVGFDRDRIKPNVPSFRKDENGRIHTYYSAQVLFISRIMNERLQELGFFSSKDERKAVPDFVKQAIDFAKEDASREGIHWSETEYGKIAHSWLLGFFDGDGHHAGGYSAKVTASNRELLLEIKRLFESPNKVNVQIEPGTKVMIFDKLTTVMGSWTLYLGPEVFKRMLASYKESMKRKRPTSNFGDFPFRLGDYYDSRLIEELRNQGVAVDESKLIAITRNQEGKIIWLEQGTSTYGFDHILQGHSDDFEEYFNIYDARDIGNFILGTIKDRQIHRSYDGTYPGDKLYVYRFGANYLKVIVPNDGFIVTAYPSRTDYF